MDKSSHDPTMLSLVDSLTRVTTLLTEKEKEVSALQIKVLNLNKALDCSYKVQDNLRNTIKTQNDKLEKSKQLEDSLATMKELLEKGF